MHLVVSEARFFRWRKIVRFESTGPAELSEAGLPVDGSQSF